MLNALTIYKSIHVLAAVIWVGSDVALHVIGVRARKAGPDKAGYFAGEIGFYSKFVLVPTSLLLIVFGFLTLDQEGLGAGELWVTFGLIVWVASFAVGAFYIGPTADKLSKAIADAGGTMPAAQAAVFDRLLLLARIELVFLLLIIVDMVVKPT